MVLLNEAHHRVHHLLLDAKDDIDLLDIEFAQAQAAYLDRRANELKCIEKLQAAIAAIRNLPPEILNEIFEACRMGSPMIIPDRSVATRPFLGCWLVYAPCGEGLC